ncbi:MAG: arylamine N-acetyltransferase [Coriobacteriia bacterium]|nr:arylamine N-acetyltransferase [Coriobacteriia bacterium]
MFEDLYVELTPEQVALYLERIGLPEDAKAFSDSWLSEGQQRSPLKPSLELLDRLVYAHQITVPFENLEIYDLGLPVELGTLKLFEKIVLHNRGGYCFELNKSFNSLLQALGFKTQAHVARIFPLKNNIRPRSHRITAVHIDDGGITKRYMADVSFGGPQPASSILLEAGVFTDWLGGSFRLTYGEVDHELGNRENTWYISRLNDGGEEQSLVSFEEVPQYEVDFVQANYYTSTHPESRFVTSRTVNLRRRDGHALMSDDLFKLKSNDVTTEIDVSDPTLRAEVLKEYFGIVL